MQDINIIGQIADVKDSSYKNTLAITTLLELLLLKGLFTRDDFNHQAQLLENATLAEITAARRLQLAPADKIKRPRNNPRH